MLSRTAFAQNEPTTPAPLVPTPARSFPNVQPRDEGSPSKSPWRERYEAAREELIQGYFAAARANFEDLARTAENEVDRAIAREDVGRRARVVTPPRYSGGGINASPALLAAGVALNTGVIGGLLLAEPVSPMVARVRLLDLGGATGYLVGAGLYAAARHDAGTNAVLGFGALGCALGLTGMWFATGSMDDDRREAHTWPSRARSTASHRRYFRSIAAPPSVFAASSSKGTITDGEGTEEA